MQKTMLARAVVGLPGLVFWGAASAQLCVLPGNTAFHDDVNNLTWLRNPPSTAVNYSTASSRATNTATDTALGGNGRLPTRAEYQSLRTQLASNGAVVGDYNTGTAYWTSEGTFLNRWTVNLASGATAQVGVLQTRLYWPVRTDASSVCTACSVAGYAQLTSSTTPSLSAAITGKQIDANAPDGENWKEIHCGTSPGDLQKVGRGPSDPVDPQVSVGSWRIANNTVTYDYGPGASYTWRVYRNTAGGLCWQQDSDSGAIIAKGTVGAAVPCVQAP